MMLIDVSGGRTAAAMYALLLASLCAGCATIESFLPVSQETVDAAFDSPNPDVRREAVVTMTRRRNAFSDDMLKAYNFFAAEDDDPVIRAIALDALGRGRAVQYAPTIVAALGDRNLQVRITAAEVLAAMPPEQMPEALLETAVGQDDPLLRARCVEALGHYDSDDVRRSLLLCLNDEAFPVRLAAREALKRFTGRDMRYDRRAWKRLLEQTPLTGRDSDGEGEPSR